MSYFPFDIFLIYFFIVSYLMILHKLLQIKFVGMYVLKKKKELPSLSVTVKGQ